MVSDEQSVAPECGSCVPRPAALAASLGAAVCAVMGEQGQLPLSAHSGHLRVLSRVTALREVHMLPRSLRRDSPAPGLRRHHTATLAVAFPPVWGACWGSAAWLWSAVSGRPDSENRTTVSCPLSADCGLLAGRGQLGLRHGDWPGAPHLQPGARFPGPPGEWGHVSTRETRRVPSERLSRNSSGQSCCSAHEGPPHPSTSQSHRQKTGECPWP